MNTFSTSARATPRRPWETAQRQRRLHNARTAPSGPVIRISSGVDRSSAGVGPTLADPASKLAEVDQACYTSADIAPNPVGVETMLAKFAESGPTHFRNSPRLVDAGPNRSMSAHMHSSSAQISGQNLAETGRVVLTLAEVGMPSADFDCFRPEFDQIRSRLGQIERLRLGAARVRQFSARTPRISAVLAPARHVGNEACRLSEPARLCRLVEPC